jgi:formylglycine-generating enzyme required for sulfatase activity/dienelactone hydrolase
MRQPQILLLPAVITLGVILGCGTKSATAGAAPAQHSHSPPGARMVDLKASDGTVLKASYFSAANPGPGVLLLHQINRTRKSWDELAGQLAAAGINTLTLDMRGFGESGSPYTKLTDAEKAQVRNMWPGDVDTAWQYLVSQPGVERNVIGVGGAGWFGVLHSVEMARQHTAEVKSLVLLSGETLQDGLQFLRQASQLPELFVVADDDEYPPTVEAMELLYITASNPGKKFVHYSAAQDAPWVWYETADPAKVPAAGGHGTDLFKPHPELPGIIVNWFVTTLIKTPGHAPADTVASAGILNQIRAPGGVVQVTQQLMEARRTDPLVQLWPEITVDIIGSDHLRAGEIKEAIEFFKLNLLAYPDSADAHNNLADAYLKDGQKDLARQLAEKGMALLNSHAAPASSWSDTEERRGEVRSGLQDVLQKVSAAPTTAPVTAPVTAPTGATSGRLPGTLFRDCPVCPEMVVLPGGTFMMGSSPSEKSWAVSHGATADAVSDESPQHSVSLRSFALGRYDVTRGEYAAFVRETGYSAGDGCGHDGEKWNKQVGLNWRKPGFSQTQRDPVVCVSWHDALAYVSWLNGKVRRGLSTPGDGPYRLPSESEWEYAARAGTTTRLWWGDDDGSAADHAWYKGNSGGRTHPVGSKSANPFGLYDMAGNVWQWTQDCYVDSYANAPSDGGAVEVGSSCMRVDRGGSWYYPSWLLRAATRERNPSDYRDLIMGFRLARSIP